MSTAPDAQLTLDACPAAPTLRCIAPLNAPARLALPSPTPLLAKWRSQKAPPPGFPR